MHFSRICRNFSTKHNELPLKLWKRFCKWFFSAKKNSAKSPSGSVDSSSDNRADFFCQKFIVLSFLKGSAHFLRENTKLLTFFSEKKQSPWKSSSRQKKRIFTVGSRFIAKLWQFSAHELKKTQKFSFFQKKRKIPQNIHLGTEMPFRLSPQEATKKTQIPLKFRIELFIGFFSGEHVFPQKVPTGAQSRVLTTVLMFLYQNSILSSKF